MKARSAAWFVKEIRKQVLANPKSPIRFDVHLTEIGFVSVAYSRITGAVKDRSAPRNKWDWVCAKTVHADPAKREQDLIRVTFLGPDCPRPPRGDRVAVSKVWYSDGERDAMFVNNSNEVRWMKPDADRGSKQLKTCRANASAGGKATAHYTSFEVIAAFTEYKNSNPPDKGAWDAAQALVRPGCALDRWPGKNAGANCYRRFERIAKDKLDLTPDDFFKYL